MTLFGRPGLAGAPDAIHTERMPAGVARCYRCLVPHPARALRIARALCGCEHDYCEACLRDARFSGWLCFVGSVCTKPARAA